MIQWIKNLICRIRGHHNFEWKSFGGLGGTYSKRICSCCGCSDEDSFTPEETF